MRCRTALTSNSLAPGKRVPVRPLLWRGYADASGSAGTEQRPSPYRRPIKLSLSPSPIPLSNESAPPPPRAPPMAQGDTERRAAEVALQKLIAKLTPGKKDAEGKDVRAELMRKARAVHMKHEEEEGEENWANAGKMTWLDWAVVSGIIWGAIAWMSGKELWDEIERGRKKKVDEAIEKERERERRALEAQGGQDGWDADGRAEGGRADGWGGR